MRNKFKLLMLSLLVCAGSFAQQAKPSDKMVKLTFDSEGRLLSFPAALLKDRNKICVEMLVPTAAILNQVGQFRTMLIKTFDAINEEERLEAYSCFFNDPAKFSIDKYLKALKSEIDFLDEDNFLKLDSNDIRFHKNASDFIPVSQFLSNLADSQFSVKIFRGQAEAVDNSLRFFYDKERKCFVFTGSCNNVDDIMCNPCGAEQDQLTYRLIKTDPLAKTLSDWFELRNTELGSTKRSNVKSALTTIAGLTIADGTFGSELSKVQTGLIDWLPYWFWFSEGELVIDPLGTLTSAYITEKKKIVKDANAKIENLIKEKLFIDGALTKIPTVIGEVELFQYIQGLNMALIKNADSVNRLIRNAKMVLNEIPRSQRALIEEHELKLRELERSLLAINQQQGFMEAALGKINTQVGQFELFKIVQGKSNDLSAMIEILTDAKDKANKIVNQKASAAAYFEIKSTLNNVLFVKSSRNSIQPQIQFNAAADYDFTAGTKRELHRVTEIPDNEKGQILIHNIDSNVSISFKHTPGTFKDDPEFTELMTELLSKIDLTSISAAGLNTVQNFAKSFFSNSGIKSATDNPCSNTANIKTRIKKLAEQLVNDGQTFFYKKSPFSEVVPTRSIYRTQREAVEFKASSPYKDSISTTQKRSGKDTMVMAPVIKVGKLRFIRLAAGIAVTDKPVTVTSVDTTTSGFRMTSTDNKARAIIGIKVYPFQNYNRDRWLLPRYPIRRISIFGGFEMLHPFDNFYLGAGYDIVPGLTFSAGKNYYLKTSYKIENNTITDTYRNYDSQGLYYSIMVDPELFIQIIKKLFKL